jgi:hypothetical protein
MEQNGSQLRSEKRTRPITSGQKNKITIPMAYEQAVSAFLKVKPEPKKQNSKRKTK